MSEEQVDPLYKQGFETAYWLKRGDSPHLRHLIEKNANGNSYHQGLLAGKKEAEIELLDKLWEEQQMKIKQNLRRKL